MPNWRLTLWLADRDGIERQAGLSIPSFATIAEGLIWAQEYDAVLSGMSNAGVVRGELRYETSITPAQAAAPGSNVFQRLYVLCTDTVTYASFTLPSPVELPYDEEGPYRGIRVQAGAFAALPAIDSLLAVLSQTVLPDGTPFPTEQVVLARGWNV